MKHFSSPYISVYNGFELLPCLDRAFNCLSIASSEFQEKDTGLAVKALKYVELLILKLEHILVKGYITAPLRIKSINALINVQSYESYCFKWCLIASIECKKLLTKQFKNNNRQQSAARERLQYTKTYRCFDIQQEVIRYTGVELDFSGIEFPVTTKCINK